MGQRRLDVWPHGARPKCACSVSEVLGVAVMTKPRKPGRPPRAGKSSDRRISIRVTEKEFKLWTTRAGKLPLGEWLRRLANQPPF